MILSTIPRADLVMTAMLSLLSSVSCFKSCKSAKYERKTEKRATAEPHMEANMGKTIRDSHTKSK